MRKSLALFILSMLPAIAAAQYFAPPLQRCKFEGDLSGDTRFYLQYGRDSWAGEGEMICSDPTHTARRTVKVTFNSSQPGRGVEATSLIHLSVNLLTTIPLEQLLVFFSVTATPEAQGLAWVVESANIQAEMSLTNVNAEFTPSLQRGTLQIK